MALPPLEGEIVLKDEATPVFTQIAQNSTKVESAFKRIRIEAESAAKSISKASDTGAIGAGGGLDNTVAGLESMSTVATEAAVKVGELNDNLSAIGAGGEAGFADTFAAKLKDVESRADAAGERIKDMREESRRTAKETKGLGESLDQLGKIGALRQIPGVSALADIGEVASDLPKISGQALALAGALGGVAAAGLAAYHGLELIIQRGKQLNIEGNIKDRLVPKFGDVDAAVAELENKLQYRLTSAQALDFIVKIDTRGPLADLQTFGQVAQTVQRYSDAFGQDWQKNLADVQKAIQDGNGSFLQQSGIIKDADQALLDYARANGTIVPQLDDLQKKQALVAAVLKDNTDVVGKGPSGVEKFIAEQDKLAVSFQGLKTAFTDFIGVLLDPNAANSFEAFANRMDQIVQAIDRVKNALSQGVELRKFAAGLGSDDQKKLADLNDEIGDLQLRMDAARHIDIPLLETLGLKDLAKNAQQEVDGFAAQQDKLIKKRDELLRDFEAGKKVSIPTVDEILAGKSASPTQQSFVPQGPPQPPEITTQTAADQQVQQGVQAQKDFLEQKKALLDQYAGEAIGVLGELGTANAKLAQTEKDLAAASQPGQLRSGLTERLAADQQQLEAIQQRLDAVNLQSRAETLTNLQGELQQSSESAQGQITLLQNLIASLADTATIQAKIETAQDKLKKAIIGGYADLGGIATSEQVQGSLKDANDAIGDALFNGFSSVREQVLGEIQALESEKANLLTKSQSAISTLNQQGVRVTGSDVVEQAQSAQELLSKSQTNLNGYQKTLEKLKGDLADVEAQIKALPSGTETAQVSGPDLSQVKSDLEKRRNEILQQIENLRTAISQVAAAPETATGALEQAKAAAEAEQKTAQARANLLKAEAEFVLSSQQLKVAVASGDTALAKQALGAQAAAEQNYRLALSQAVAARASTELSDTTTKLPASFAEVVNAAERMRTEGISGFQTYHDQAIALIGDTKTQIEGTTIGPPKPPPPQANTGPSFFGGFEQAGQVKDLVGPIQQVTAANADLTTSWGQVTAAIGSTLGATAQGAAGMETLAGSTAGAAESYSVFFPVIAQAAQAAGSLAPALGSLSASTEKVVQEGIKTYDAISGLPVAFNTAGLTADQLAAKMANLSLSLQNIEFNAVQAGFSIANRLTPALGSAGALQVGRQFAGEADQLAKAIDAQNAALAKQGQAPLGLEVVNNLYDRLAVRQQALVENTVTSSDRIAQANQAMADSSSAAAQQMNSALDGIISGVLQDSTKGLIPDDILNKLLPREDAVDEKARRMADVAVKGFQSPWFEGLKDLIPPDVLAQGEEAIKRFAAQMVREHQEGLTTALYDVDAAAAKVIERIQAQQNQKDLVAQVREKVKGLAGASDLDIMDALGIDTAPVRLQQFADKAVESFDGILTAVKDLGASGTDSPITKLLNPSDDDKKTLESSGSSAIQIVGDAMVTAASDGQFGGKAISALLSSIDDKKESIANKGKQVAQWMGGKMLDQFREDVPSGLLEILVSKLIPLMVAAGKAEAEREGGGGAAQ